MISKGRCHYRRNSLQSLLEVPRMPWVFNDRLFKTCTFLQDLHWACGVNVSYNAWKLSALWDLASVSSRGCREKYKAKSLKSIFLAEGFSFSTKRKLIILLNFPFLSVSSNSALSILLRGKKLSRGDGLCSGQVWGGPPELNFNFVIFWLLRTTGLKRSPFGQTSVRFQGEHRVKRTPGECWVTKFALTCLTASKSWQPAE